MSRLTRELRGFLASHRDALRVFRLAPLALALVIAPELAQHAAEIQLGMFADKTAFAAHQGDALRGQLGTAKLVGLTLAVVFTARFWANRATGRRAWSLADIVWKPLALGFLVQVLAAVPGMLPLDLDPAVTFAAGAVLTLLSLPGIVLMVAGLLGDRTLGLRAAYARGWGKALRIALYVAPGWTALQFLHEWDHHTALGQGAGLVWALMVWDSLVVGLMAALGGTGLHHGYRGPDEA
ncbi:hypothetical protein MTR62_02320 [Novosphingobium sp. 1949]|uniref:Uncharacterized protein n=1 Tax=Novosphingobium organovorum TaxID=2930092 RepID=A0ABT0B931_9SPHN|nr:hypothetical protein [Novosphingobium organovorum]MCJ2181549.1 hypothetical protein [Novosphingobium organovorum]